MSNVRNCRRCGKLYNYIGGAPICSSCREKDEEDFKRVKEYLYENPGATLSEVANTLEVSVEKIRRFLREGRLEIVGDDGNMFLECENCGKAIRTGRFCDQCGRDIQKELQTTAADMDDALYQSRFRSGGSGLKYLSKDDSKPK
jgi:flagellar operon protein (TIGR03826 family)